MSHYAHYINILLGLGAIIIDALCIVALVVLAASRKENIYLAFIKKYFLQIGLFISAAAVLTSLFYSEIMHYTPCFYCWMDRIYIFPQAVIFFVAWLRKDKNAFWYSIILTLFGLYNSIHHIFIYYLGEGTNPCDSSGVSCVQRLVNEFGGYVSIPTLAFTGFFALTTLLLVVFFYKKDENMLK